MSIFFTARKSRIKAIRSQTESKTSQSAEYITHQKFIFSLHEKINTLQQSPAWEDSAQQTLLQDFQKPPFNLSKKLQHKLDSTVNYWSLFFINKVTTIPTLIPLRTKVAAGAKYPPPTPEP